MAKFDLTLDILPVISERFRALADPARLHLLICLRAGSMTVSELVEATALQQANVSKHLQILHERGFVTRRKEGLFVRYSLAGSDIFRLCDIMCGRLEAELTDRAAKMSVARPDRRRNRPAAARRAKSP